MSQRMASVRAAERAVPLKMRRLVISDTAVDINHVRYQLGVFRDYPNGDSPMNVKSENARGGVVTDSDQFGFEFPISSSPILPGDVSVRNGNERVVRTDTDELEEHYQNELTRCEILLQGIAGKESGVEPKMDDSWRENGEYSKERLQKMANHAREKLKPFHCKRHNLPRPFNCYIQLSTMKDGEDKPLLRLAYTRKLNEAVKHFNHILFANRPAIRVNELVCRGNQVYRIPVGLKISTNELTVRQSQIASIAKILEGDVDTLRVFRRERLSERDENWWQRRPVQNAKQLIADDFSLMFRPIRNKIIRLHNIGYLTTGQYCQLIENWMSVKRDVGSELWIGVDIKKRRKNVLEVIQTRTEVIRRDESSVRIRGINGTHIEVCEEVCEDESMDDYWAVRVKLMEN
ncbi:hypothetical protein B9Z55_007767 [Caenorhabditis nigoni]|nr:hypothetical protein B9Z55_007767 [Caenorhabditis nigoni]